MRYNIVTIGLTVLLVAGLVGFPVASFLRITDAERCARIGGWLVDSRGQCATGDIKFVEIPR